MKKMVLTSLSIAALFAAGCSTSTQSNSSATAPVSATPANSNSASLEGAWTGRDITPGQEAPATLTFSGQTIDFHGSGPNDWIKGTFTLQEDTTPKQLIATVTDCGDQHAIGKKTYVIYKIEDGTLTITGNPLGDPNFPATFDAAGARAFSFKRNQ